MKKTIFSILLIYTSAFADFDREAYISYKKTNQYQLSSAKATEPFFVNMRGAYSKKDSMLHWSLTLLKIESLTGEWADLGAIAKGNHKNFVNVTLTPVLIEYDGKKIYRCQTIQRKTMFGKDNKVKYTSPVPKNINFASVTIEVGLITDSSKNKPTINTKSSSVEQELMRLIEKREALILKKEKEKERAVRRAEIEKINESLHSRGLLQEVRNERKKEAIEFKKAQEEKHLPNKQFIGINELQQVINKTTAQLSNRAKTIEDDISRADRELAKKLAEIERERQARMSALDRKIKELEKMK